jgi:hypothetical protein
MASYPKKRMLSRFPLEVPVQIVVAESSETYSGKTANVSAQGIFFRTSARLKLGQDVACTLLLPETLTHAEQPIFVDCKGSVVRVEETAPEAPFGVAIEVNSYDFSGSRFGNMVVGSSVAPE